MNTNMRLVIEVLVEKSQQAGAALVDLGKKVAEVRAAFADGLKDGAEQAAKELARPRAELEKLAKDARENLKIRPHIEIDADIAKVKQAYADLKSSGMASMTELAQAKLKMKERIIELKSETNGWVDTIGKAKMAFAGLVTAGAGLGAAGKAAIDFESAMAEVRKTTDATPEQLNKLGDAIKGMSASMPVAQAELAQIAALGGQLGIPMSELNSFMGVTAKTSVAFGMSAEQTADAIGKLANVFGLPIPGVTDLNNAVNVLGNSMAATERDILTVLTRTGGIARQFGLSAKETAALASSMLSLGDAPEVAGTAINNLLTKLQSANVQSKGFKAALETIGSSAEKLADDVQKNPQKALNEFLGTIEKLSAKDKTEVLGELFGAGYDTASIAKLAGNLKLYQEALGKASGDTGGALDKEFAARLETTQASLDMAGNSFRNLAIAVGDVFAPAIEKVAQLVGKAAQGIAQFSEDHPMMAGAIATFATLAASATALSLGWSALALGGAKLIESVSGILTAIKGISLFLIANPVVAAILGIAAAGVAAYVYWDEIVAAADKAMQGIRRAFDKAAASVKATAKAWWQIGADIIDGLWQGIQATIRKPLDAIGDLAKKLPQWAKDLLGIKSPSRVFMAIGHDIGAGLVIGIGDSEDAVRQAVEGLGQAAIYAGDGATMAMIRDQEASLADLSESGADAVKAVEAADKKIKATFRDSKGRYLPADEAERAAAEWQRTAADIERSLTDALMRGFEGGKDAAKNFRDTIVNTLKTAFIKPIAVKISASVLGAVGMGGAGMAVADGGGGYGSTVSALSTIASGFAPGAASFAIGEGVAGIASAFGASTGVATGIGAAAAYAVPVLGWIAAILSLVSAFGKGGTPHLGTTREFDLTGKNRVVGIDEWRAAGGDSSGLPGWLFGEGDKSPFNDAVSAFGQQISATLKADMKALGGTLGKDFALQFGFAAEAEAETGSGGFARVMLGGESVLDIYKRYAKDGKEGLQQYLAEVAPKVELVALQVAEGLSPAIFKLAHSLNASIASVSEVNLLLVKIKESGQALSLRAAFDDLRVSMGSTDEQAIATGLALRELSGSFDALQAGITTYYQQYFSEAEQMADLTRKLADQFSGLSLAMPETKAQFRALVESLDVTSEAGQKAFVALMGMAPAFATMTDAAAEAATGSAGATASAAADAARDAARAAEDFRAAWKDIGNSLIDEIKRIRGVVAGTAGVGFAKAQSDFAIATAKARAGDQSAGESLPELSQALLELAEGVSGTAVDLQRLRATTAASLEVTLRGIGKKTGVTIPAFASGGSYAGGLALVGETGPEIINFNRPGYVHNSTQTAGMLNNAALLSELAALRDEVTLLRAETRATVTHTGKTARLLERVMPDGDALATRAAV